MWIYRVIQTDVGQTEIDPDSTSDQSAQIAGTIRAEIVAAGSWWMNACCRDGAVQSFAALAAHGARRAYGAAFVYRMPYTGAYGQHITNLALLLSMTAIGVDVACEARFALERHDREAVLADWG